MTSTFIEPAPPVPRLSLPGSAFPPHSPARAFFPASLASIKQQCVSVDAPAHHQQQSSQQKTVRKELGGSTLQQHRDLRERVTVLEERVTQHELATTNVVSHVITTLSQFLNFADRVTPMIAMMCEKLHLATSNPDILCGDGESMPKPMMQEVADQGDVRPLENDLLSLQDNCVVLRKEVDFLQQQRLGPFDAKADAFIHEVPHHANLILTQSYSHQELCKQIADLQEQLSTLSNQSSGRGSVSDASPVQNSARDCDVIWLARGFQNSIASLQKEVKSLKKLTLSPKVGEANDLMHEVVRHGDFASILSHWQNAVSTSQEEATSLTRQCAAPCDAHIQAVCQDSPPHRYCTSADLRSDEVGIGDHETERPSQLDQILSKLGDMIVTSKCRDTDEHATKRAHVSPCVDERTVLMNDA